MPGWVACLVSIRFDVDHGPTVEHVQPADALDEDGRRRVIQAAFPDCNPDCGHNFIFTVELDDCTLASAHEREAVVAAPNTAGSLTGRLWATACYRQKQDASVPRGYVQQVLLLLSHLPYFTVHELILRVVAPRFAQCCPYSPDTHKMLMSSALSPRPSNHFAEDSSFNPSHYTQMEVLDRAWCELAEWPSPLPHTRYDVMLLHQSMEFITPSHILPLTRAVAANMMRRAEPRRLDDRLRLMSRRGRESHDSSDEVLLPLFALLGAQLAHLTRVWELILSHEPILIMSNTPSTASATANAVASLILPIKFCGSFLPYFTVQHDDFARLRRFGKELPFSTHEGIIAAATNPFILRSCEGWPHLLVVMDRFSSHGMDDAAPPHPQGADVGGAGAGHNGKRRQAREARSRAGGGGLLHRGGEQTTQPSGESGILAHVARHLTTLASFSRSTPPPPTSGAGTSDAEPPTTTLPYGSTRHTSPLPMHSRTSSLQVWMESKRHLHVDPGASTTCTSMSDVPRVASFRNASSGGRHGDEGESGVGATLDPPRSGVDSSLWTTPETQSSERDSCAEVLHHSPLGPLAQTQEGGLAPAEDADGDDPLAYSPLLSASPHRFVGSTAAGIDADSAMAHLRFRRLSSSTNSLSSGGNNGGASIDGGCASAAKCGVSAPHLTAVPVSHASPPLARGSPTFSSTMLAADCPEAGAIFTHQRYLEVKEQVAELRHTDFVGGARKRQKLQHRMTNHIDSSHTFLLNHSRYTERLLGWLDRVSALDCGAQRDSVALISSNYFGSLQRSGSGDAPPRSSRVGVEDDAHEGPHVAAAAASPQQHLHNEHSGCHFVFSSTFNGTPSSDSVFSEFGVADDILRKFFISLTQEFLSPITAFFTAITSSMSAFQLCDAHTSQSLLSPDNFLSWFADHHREVAPTMWSSEHNFSGYKPIYDRFARGVLFTRYMHQLVDGALRKAAEDFQMDDFVKRFPSELERIDVFIGVFNLAQRELTQRTDPDILFVRSLSSVLAAMAVSLSDNLKLQFLMKLEEFDV